MTRRRPVPLTTRPTVSVVIPCYNYGHYLPGAVASALDQEGVDVDVLVVDDASTDDSAAVARSLAESDPRVDVLVHEVNRGHIAAYNDGLAKARGDYVVLISRWLRRRFRALAPSPTVPERQRLAPLAAPPTLEANP